MTDDEQKTLAALGGMRDEDFHQQEEVNRPVVEGAIGTGLTGRFLIESPAIARGGRRSGGDGKTGKKGAGTVTVTSYDDHTGTYDESFENVDKLSFNMADTDVLDHLTIQDNGGGEVLIRFPTTEVTGAVNGKPSTLIVCTDGTGWQEI